MVTPNGPVAPKGAVPAPKPLMVPALSGPRLSRTPEELAAELAQATKAPGNAEMATKLEAGHAKAAEADRAEMTGKDLDFDVKAFLAWGVIRKENIKILDGVYVDIQSLTQRERLVAEQLVKSRFGNLSAADNLYTSALESAILAVAVTRINNVEYPIPTMKLAAEDAKAYAERFDKKGQLYDYLLDSSEKLVGFLSVLYNKLEAADVLKDVKEGTDTGKKSDAPSSPENSGSSAAS